MTKKKLEDGTVVLKVEVQKLAVKLDAQGIAAEGIVLANLLQEHEQFMEATKSLKSKLAKDETAIQSRIDGSAAAIRAGVALRDVEVEIRADFERGVAEFVRLDTNETLTKRTLTDEERQRKMIFDDRAADKAIEDGEVPKINLSDLTDEELRP